MDRRTVEYARLRVYMDEVKRVREMTDEQWVNEWVRGADVNTAYVSKLAHVEFLESCILSEVSGMLSRAA